ncbi:hypothetical protein BMIN_0705 [Bifidobacterium minimum]|uniref:Uncharacterized protein n=1 Tax=Bifidobacterium minimum TaxID=1693 RepID=A0A087BPP2_9BIFI|nr:hypothetical protein BMIN_0705 [Bifidobacterium minimum]
MPGSSPRVRGKRGTEPANAPASRIIPASAGQTGCVSRHNQVCEDHPRECGANATTPPAMNGNAGSSPRVRGKHSSWERIGWLRRIIPASAGQT